MLLLAQESPKSKEGPQASEIGTWQGLGENVGDVVMTRDTPYGEGAVFNAFSNKMMADINMFASGVVSGVRRKCLGAVVVTEEHSGIGFEEMDFAQELS
jgi:hypothetical protein